MITADHYQVLGIDRGATPDDIKAAFRRLAYLHPDQHPGDPTASDRFARISTAYTVLSDSTQRAAYDGRPPSSAPVTEAVDLVVEIVKGAQQIDARAGLRLADKVATAEGRQQIRGFWAGLQSLLR